MKKSFCFGFIVFRKTLDFGFEFLLLKNVKGHYDFPKGHKDNLDNSKIETAIRETFEETGIKNLNILKEFSLVMDYVIDSKTDTPTHKFVELFLAELQSDTQIVLSSEHTEYKWCDLEQSLSLFEFDNYKSALLSAYNFLKFIS